MKHAVPVIIDLVGSRVLSDRHVAQSHVRQVFELIEPVAPAHVPLWATVGDEFQVVYHRLDHALRATALVRLLAEGAFDCRFGIGVGPIRTIEQGPKGPIDEGEGWYRARHALDECERMQTHGQPWMRTWATLTDPTTQPVKPANLPAGTPNTEKAVQAYLMTRDHVIGRMKAKESRIAAAWLMGVPQQEIARQEKLSQPGVSSRLANSGGTAIVQADRIFSNEPEANS